MPVLIKKTCEYCHQTFEISRSRTARPGRGKFCSKACWRAYQRTSRPRQTTCQQCGKIFSASPHRIERAEAKHCSHECHWLAQKRELVDYFWSQIDQTGSCWLWIGPINSGNGYGRFSFEMREVYAHRVSYELHYGPIPTGRQVCHHCDNHLCVHPDHLFLGTQRENNLDRDFKDRVRHGENHASAKLTEADVIAIREAYAANQTTYRALAQQYNVSHGTISGIIGRRTWKRVP